MKKILGTVLVSSAIVSASLMASSDIQLSQEEMKKGAQIYFDR